MVKINGKEVEWHDTPKGWYLTDVRQHILWQNEETGARFVLMKFPKGGNHEHPHTHPHANQWAMGLLGEMEQPNGTRIKFTGDAFSFQFTPKGEKHGGLPDGGKFCSDCYGLFYFDGPLTKEFE